MTFFLIKVKYSTKSCSGDNNQVFFSLFINPWTGFIGTCPKYEEQFFLKYENVWTVMKCVKSAVFKTVYTKIQHGPTFLCWIIL